MDEKEKDFLKRIKIRPNEGTQKESKAEKSMSRRDFLKVSASAATTLALGGEVLTGCSKSDNNSEENIFADDVNDKLYIPDILEDIGITSKQYTKYFELEEELENIETDDFDNLRTWAGNLYTLAGNMADSKVSRLYDDDRIDDVSASLMTDDNDDVVWIIINYDDGTRDIKVTDDLGIMELLEADTALMALKKSYEQMNPPTPYNQERLNFKSHLSGMLEQVSSAVASYHLYVDDNGDIQSEETGVKSLYEASMYKEETEDQEELEQDDDER